MLVRDLPRKQVEIAAYPCTYTYMKAGKLKSPCLEGITPIFTDVDEGLWIRANEYVTAFGTYDGQIVKSVKRQHEEMPDWQIPDADWDAFYPSLDKALKRMSIIGQLECGGLTRGAEHFTPDKFPVVGETAQAHGYYVVTGLSGQGLAWAGGIGKILADMMYGTPEVDVTKIEVTRFINLHTGKQYLMERTPDVAGKVFKRTYRSHQFGTARKLRTSPIHQQMTDAGAVFGEVMGYERPLWFLGKSEKTRNPMFSGQDDLIGRPEWFSRVAKEYEACRERVGLIDLSSYAKFDVMGPDCVKLLQWLCSANIDVPVGSMVYSGMQNEMGGYVTDCTISRIGKKHYFIIAPTVQQLRLPMWIQKWIFAKKYNVTLQLATLMANET
ncbi:hypothetical protein AB6A40_007540 [Gnathostoma spinigerum]|uniref:FAD dependent oxidoreductase domain-containing protein n=1 Tax=Gnathostoma spinigerum TaxID=75299 RepID=A0ABD6ETQ3_9BILA